MNPHPEHETDTTGAKFMADTFNSWGIDHVFFVDAVLRETLVELEKRNISRILAHSEKGAAYMADGYARASGKPGICMAQSVGAANLAAGLQDAYLNRTPVVAITGRKSARYQYRNAYQELPHQPMFASVTKGSFDVAQAEQLPYLLSQALVEAASGTPRPTHLDLCGYRGADIETTGVGLGLSELKLFESRRPVPLGVAHEESLFAARELLNSSLRPVLVLGVGATLNGIGEAALAFARTWGASIATSVGARGLVPTDSIFHLGVVGTYSAPFANEKLAQSDLVVFVGCHTGDQVTNDWTIPSLDCKVIQIDVDPAEIGRNYPSAVGLLGHPVLTLQALAAMQAEVNRSLDWPRECSSAAAAWLESTHAISRTSAPLLRAEWLARTLSEGLAEDTILVADTGFSATWTAQYTEFRSTKQRYLRAAGSLGWAFPAALGAQCADLERSVVCFTGDGALHYHLSELETMRRWSLPVVLVVNNNSAFGQGLRSVKKLYEGKDGSLDDLVRFVPVNFAEVAASFGISGHRVTQANDFLPILQSAVRSRVPCVIDVVTDPDCNPETPWSR